MGAGHVPPTGHSFTHLWIDVCSLQPPSRVGGISLSSLQQSNHHQAYDELVQGAMCKQLIVLDFQWTGESTHVFSSRLTAQTPRQESAFADDNQSKTVFLFLQCLQGSHASWLLSLMCKFYELIVALCRGQLCTSLTKQSSYRVTTVM